MLKLDLDRLYPEKKEEDMNSSDKCVAICIASLAAVVAVSIICFTVYHLKFVESGLVEQVQMISVPAKVWVRK